MENKKLFFGIMFIAIGMIFFSNAYAANPLYPAFENNLWGYINDDNQWVVPPHSIDPLDYTYDDDFLYDWWTDEWIDAQGNRYTQEEIIDPEMWGITELNGEDVWFCNSQRFGESWLVSCYAYGDSVGTNAPMGYLLLDNNMGRLSDDVYYEFFIAEDDRHAIVSLEENAETGSLIDERGQILRVGLPLGRLSADGTVVSRQENWETLYFDAFDATQLDERKVAALHAANCPEGLWPCEIILPQETPTPETGNIDWSSWDFAYDNNEIKYIVYVDAEGNIAEHLGHFREASEFADGFAAVLTEDEKSLIIDTKGNVVLEDVSIVNGHWYGAPEMRDGWAAVTIFSQGRTVREGCNYLNEDGRMMYPDNCLYSAEPFFEGRALIGVLMEDCSLVYAQIDPDGRVVWAENGVDVETLQMQLDQGSCMRIADISAEEAMEMLQGEWVSRGGGEFLKEIQKEDGTRSVPLTDDGTWSIRRTAPGEIGYCRNDFVFIKIYHDKNGNEKTTEIELTILHRDYFRVSFGEGSSGYVRQGSRSDENSTYKLIENEKKGND